MIYIFIVLSDIGACFSFEFTMDLISPILRDIDSSDILDSAPTWHLQVTAIR
jgi:hypothetical protein